MTLQELITDLKAAGANDNTMQLAMNCYELGLKNATEVEREACAKLVEESWMAFSRAPLFRLSPNPFPELKFAAKRIRARGNA